jgi:hypothetical protein
MLSVWTHKLRPASFKWVVWFRWAQFIELFSLRWAQFIEFFSLRWAQFIELFSLSCIMLQPCSHSVVNESDAHIHVYAVISIDNIIKLITYKQAVKSSLCDKWKMAMKNEIQLLKNNNTWDIVNVLLNQHVLKEHWVYKVKCDTHDQVSHYKACWVVKDYKQQFDIDYDQTFVSVIKLQTYKTLLLQHIMTLKWIKWTLLLCSFMTLSIRLFTLSYLTAMSYLTRLLCWIRPSMAWSKHLVCDIRLYTIFSSLDFCWLDSDHSMFIQNSVIITVYVNNFLLVKRISQLFRTLNNVLMTHLRCQISVLCSTI